LAIQAVRSGGAYNRECSQGVRVTGGPKESWKKIKVLLG
jgi:hypothetical protein